MKRALAVATIVVATAGAGAAAYAAGVSAGQASVWQYIGPGTYVCDSTNSDNVDCWALPDH